MIRPVFAWFLPLALLTGDDPFHSGVRAYQAGDFATAFAAFTAAEQAAGDEASAELLYDRALAALQLGRLLECETSAEKMVARGGPDFAPRREFLLGNSHFARGQRAAAEATLLDADPTAFGRAITAVETAIDHWREAIVGCGDWPAARRNIERAMLELAELHRKRAEAEQQPKNAGQQDPPPPDPDTEEIEQEMTAQAEPDRLTTEQLALLLEVLAQKERDKRALREEQHRARAITVEQDW